MRVPLLMGAVSLAIKNRQEGTVLPNIGRTSNVTHRRSKIAWPRTSPTSSGNFERHPAIRRNIYRCELTAAFESTRPAAVAEISYTARPVIYDPHPNGQECEDLLPIETMVTAYAGVPVIPEAQTQGVAITAPDRPKPT